MRTVEDARCPLSRKDRDLICVPYHIDKRGFLDSPKSIQHLTKVRSRSAVDERDVLFYMHCLDETRRSQRIVKHRGALGNRRVVRQNDAVSNQQFAILRLHPATAHSHVPADDVLWSATSSHHKASTFLAALNRLPDTRTDASLCEGSRRRQWLSAVQTLRT